MAIVGLVAGSLGCSGTRTCEIRGRVVGDEHVLNRPCWLDMYIGDRPDRISHTPIVINRDFGVQVSVRTAAPRSTWHDRHRRLSG